MKKIQTILIFWMLLLLVSCASPRPSSQGLTAQENSDSNTSSEHILSILSALQEGESVNLPDMDITDTVVEKKQRMQNTSLGESCYVYVLSKKISETAPCRSSFLMVAWDQMYCVTELAHPCYELNLSLCDVDGDQMDEIIVHRNLDSFGGAGQFMSQVFRVAEEGIYEIFASKDGEKCFDTGFYSEYLSGKRLKITNRFTEKEQILDISYFIDECFDEEGVYLLQDEIWCDSFFEFIPTDVDSDGIFEIVGIQYTSLGNHASGIGNGKVVLRYNVEQEDFFVIDSEFLFQNETVKNTGDGSMC